MENKKTTELLDLIDETVNDRERADELEAAIGELMDREVFVRLLEHIEVSFKQLRRHKHDPHTGDVMIRI